jgi:hypothetical protein
MALAGAVNEIERPLLGDERRHGLPGLPFLFQKQVERRVEYPQAADVV